MMADTNPDIPAYRFRVVTFGLIDMRVEAVCSGCSEAVLIIRDGMSIVEPIALCGRHVCSPPTQEIKK